MKTSAFSMALIERLTVWMFQRLLSSSHQQKKTELSWSSQCQSWTKVKVTFSHMKKWKWNFTFAKILVFFFWMIYQPIMFDFPAWLSINTINCFMHMHHQSQAPVNIEPAFGPGGPTKLLVRIYFSCSCSQWLKRWWKHVFDLCANKMINL